jgi:predicted Fe-S protein YdhL (DUF1289 family)
MEIAEEPVSPCNQVCSLDPRTGLCVGCLRTGDEIAGWIGFSREQKAALLALLVQRRAAGGARLMPQNTMPGD